MSTHGEHIYKITTTALWQRALKDGTLPPSPVDQADGFMHFSTASQLRETLRLHFAGQTGLILLVIAVDRLPLALKWEPSRGGDLFPHLYAPLECSAVLASHPISVDAAGQADLPGELA